MRSLLEKKINYDEEKEAPMILGMKILKKLEKEWGKDSDIYYEVEDLLIDFGSDNPRRLAMALKRLLTNWDMWEPPYKGYVNKIEKWVKPIDKVNEGYYTVEWRHFDNDRVNRYEGLVESIEYYSYMLDKNKTLSRSQIRDLKDIRDKIVLFGENGLKWAFFANDLLNECGFYDDFEELYHSDYEAIEESNKPLDKPLFRKPVHFVKTFKEEVYDFLDEMIDKGLVDYSDLWEVYTKYDIDDELVNEIIINTNLSWSGDLARNILNIIAEYFEEAYQNHLIDMDENGVPVNENDTEEKGWTRRPQKGTKNDSKSKPNKLSQEDFKKYKKQKETTKNKSNFGKAALAATAAGATYLGKKYVVDPISKSLE